tara:strand:+ start:5168 stop:5554 length:387 start_codon:yes stop_codon:yes gene_type:complete
MLRNTARLVILLLLNYLVIFGSTALDVEQLFKDLYRFTPLQTINIETLHFLISFIVSSMTLFLIYFFKPFIEMYLTHYLKYNFYFLINLLSLSTVYIVFRIYGYSRFYLLIYLFLSTIALNILDKYFR